MRQIQGLEITLRQLIKKAMKLLEEEYVKLDTKCLVDITNKSSASDGWRITIVTTRR